MDTGWLATLNVITSAARATKIQFLRAESYAAVALDKYLLSSQGCDHSAGGQCHGLDTFNKVVG